jgi:hypothetical protein
MPMKSLNGERLMPETQDLLSCVQETIAFVRSSVVEGRSAHEVEVGLWQRALAMGRQAYGYFLEQCGDGDMGEEIPWEGDRRLRRLEPPHPREIRNVFGLFELKRRVYGTREGQKIEYVPLDARLQLPESKNSYLLQDWDQGLAVSMPYQEVTATLERILGLKQSVHTLERDQQEMAKAQEAFWKEQPIPPAEEEGELLIATADHKGIPMRGCGEAPAGPQPPSNGGLRPGTKKMALIGAVYTVDRHVRTPEEVLEALFHERPVTDPRPHRPTPCFKHVRASLRPDGADRTEAQTHEIFSWIAQEAAQRNPDGKKPVVLLMDGQQSLLTASWKYLPETEATEVADILDLLHALGYLWEAAHLFHPSGSAAAAAWVKEQARRMLHGQIGSVIQSLRWQGTHAKLKGKAGATLERICGYFQSNSHRMAYDVYLELGFPIASGVIEGACRCVVKDRMERSGMRWVLSGARAMLNMRCISLSHLWDKYIQFRIQRESARLYPGSAANEADFCHSLAA